jgi:uncharacterized protein
MPDCFVPWTVQLAGAGAPAMSFSGLAAVYGRPDDGREYTFARGAFDAPVKAARQGKFPAMLLQHGGWDMSADDMLPIGVWTDISADEEGLKVSGVLAETTRGTDIYRLMKLDPRPAIDGLSIGFRPTKRQVNENAAPGEARITIQEIELLEISVVTFPAMLAARVTSVQSELSERNLERRLVRDAGLSRREARALLRSGKSGIEALRDAGELDDDEGALPSAALAELAARIRRNTEMLKG